MIASLTFTSCEDFLTEEVRGQQNLDTYFQSAEEAEAFITGCYQAITLADGGISTQYGCFPRCVVMTVGWAIPAKVKVTIFLWPTIKVPDKQWCHLQLWQYRYKGILRCNIAVERISQADFSDEEMKNRLVAEARFLRGYFYLNL